MKWSGLILAVACGVAPLTAAPQKDAGSSPSITQNITLRGCVLAGEDKGTYVLTRVTEVPQAGRSAIPATAHGRRVVFWLDKDAELLKHANHAVEVTGVLNGVEESEIELKSGTRKDGGLMAEFEGPGKDIKVPNEAVAGAVGTTGRTAPEARDIKTILMKVRVTAVQAVDYSCREQ